MRAILLFVFLLTAARAEALSGTSERELRVVGLNSFVPIPSDLKLASEELHQFFRSENFNAGNCAPSLAGIYSSVTELKAAQFDRKATLENAETILSNLWVAKLQLRKRLLGFHEAGTLEKPCVNTSRDLLRAIRFVEDYVGYLKLRPGPPPASDKPQRKAFSGGYPYLQLNPAFEKLELRSGDIFLSRGAAYTSAAIARVGDIDGQFSHLAILYIDEKTQKKYLVEAHIEVGAQNATFETYISDGKARALVFRHPDAELAKLAAKRIYNLVQKAHDSGENVPYDFTMDMKDHSELFCTEVVSYGFEMAAKELHRDFSMPLFPTGIHMKNQDFIRAIGVKVDSTFAPSDIEVDPRFELVAEWRDFSRVPLLHYHDAILEKEFEWMEKRDYTFKTNLLDFIASNILHTVRRMPFLSSLVKDQFPTNMTQATLRAVGSLFRASDPLFAALEAADNKMMKKTGLLLTHRELGQVLERYRLEDLERNRTYQEWLRYSRGQGEGPPSPEMHWHLGPRNE